MKEKVIKTKCISCNQEILSPKKNDLCIECYGRALKKIPLDTALWSVIHTHLLESGVKFPKSNWETIGICYGAYTKIGEVLKEYFEPKIPL